MFRKERIAASATRALLPCCESKIVNFSRKKLQTLECFQ